MEENWKEKYFKDWLVQFLRLGEMAVAYEAQAAAYRQAIAAARLTKYPTFVPGGGDPSVGDYHAAKYRKLAAEAWENGHADYPHNVLTNSRRDELWRMVEQSRDHLSHSGNEARHAIWKARTAFRRQHLALWQEVEAFDPMPGFQPDAASWLALA